MMCLMCVCGVVFVMSLICVCELFGVVCVMCLIVCGVFCNV